MRDFTEFYELGFSIDPIPLSSIHGSGSGDVLDAACEALGEWEDSEDDGDVINVAVIGKPNAGKSSLVNRILGSERMIVSDIAGTTRDAIDTPFENETGKYNFIDTAGIRRQSKVDDRIEKYSSAARAPCGREGERLHSHDRRDTGDHRTGREDRRDRTRGGQGRR